MSDDVVSLKVDASAGVRAYQEMVDAAARASEAQARFASIAAINQRALESSAASAAILATNLGKSSDAANRAADMHARLSAASGTAASHLDSVSSKLDLVGKAAGVASTGLDAVGFIPAGVAASEMSAKIEATVGILDAASAAANYASEFFNSFSERALASAAANDALAVVSAKTIDAEGRLISETKELTAATIQSAEAANKAGDAESSNAAYYVVAGVALAGLAAATYASSQAIAYIAGQLYDAGVAVKDWVSDISGAAGLETQFSQSALDAAEAHRVLALELGAQADELTHVAEIASDYEVSTETATAGLRRMIEVLTVSNEKTAEARSVLRSYIGSLDGLTAPEALDKFAERMNTIRDGAAKTRDALSVLGSDGVKWLKGIADGGADASHSFTEADRIAAVLAATIAASNAKIAEHKTYWEQVIERIDALVTRTDEFKAKQEYALSHIAVAWRELGNTNQSVGEEISNVWNGMIQTAEEYGRVIAEKIIPLQGMVKPLVVPELPKDTRPETPSVHRQALTDADTSTTKAVEAARNELETMKLQKENWLTWSNQREIEYWTAKRQVMLAELPKTLSDEEAARTAGIKRVDSIILGLGRDTAKAQVSAAESALKDIEKASQAEADRSLQATVLKLRAEEQEVAKNGAAKVAKQREIAEAVRAAKGDDSVEYLAEMVKVQQAEREAGQQTARIKQDAAEAAAKISLSSLDAERDALAQRRAMGEISAADELTQAVGIEDRKRAIRLSAAQQRLADLKAHDSSNIEEVRKAEEAITQLMAEQEAQRAKDLNAAILERKKAAKELALIEAEGLASQANFNVDSRQKDVSFGKSMGTIDGSQEIAAARAIADEKYQIERDLLDRKLALAGQEEAERARIANQLVDLEQRRALQMRQIDHQESLNRLAEINAVVAPFTSATQQMTQGFIQGTLTRQQLAARAAQSIAISYANMGVKIATDWLQKHVLMAAYDKLFATREVAQAAATQADKTGVTASGTAARNAIGSTEGQSAIAQMASTVAEWFGFESAKTGATVAGESTRAAASAGAAAEKKAITAPLVLSDAGEAAANVYANVSAIPFVGWIMAPIAAATAFAAVAAFSSYGGEAEVPYDGALYRLHAKETVLPASIAVPLKAMIQGGVPQAMLPNYNALAPLALTMPNLVVPPGFSIPRPGLPDFIRQSPAAEWAANNNTTTTTKGGDTHVSVGPITVHGPVRHEDIVRLEGAVSEAVYRAQRNGNPHALALSRGRK